MPEPTATAPPAVTDRYRHLHLGPAQAGTPPMLGYNPATVYLAASEWLSGIVDQLMPPGDDGTHPPYWSANLLFVPIHAAVVAAVNGMDNPQAAAIVVMMAAHYTLGDVSDDADNRPSLGLAKLTDPTTPRAVVIQHLRHAAADLKFCHDTAAGMAVAVEHFPHVFTPTADTTPEDPR